MDRVGMEQIWEPPAQSVSQERFLQEGHRISVSVYYIDLEVIAGLRTRTLNPKYCFLHYTCTDKRTLTSFEGSELV